MKRVSICENENKCVSRPAHAWFCMSGVLFIWFGMQQRPNGHNSKLSQDVNFNTWLRLTETRFEMVKKSSSLRGVEGQRSSESQEYSRRSLGEFPENSRRTGADQPSTFRSAVNLLNNAGISKLMNREIWNAPSKSRVWKPEAHKQVDPFEGPASLVKKKYWICLFHSWCTEPK